MNAIECMWYRRCAAEQFVVVVTQKIGGEMNLRLSLSDNLNTGTAWHGFRIQFAVLKWSL